MRTRCRGSRPGRRIDEDRMADIFLGAGLARIDNLFMKTRRLFNAFERPVGTSSGHNAVWHGYSPYNPRMVQKYLTIFRTVNNWTFVGNDGQTPAMRLGFTKQPLDFEDILWAGERVPRLRRSRRKRIPDHGLRRRAARGIPVLRIGRQVVHRHPRVRGPPRRQHVRAGHRHRAHGALYRHRQVAGPGTEPLTVFRTVASFISLGTIAERRSCGWGGHNTVWHGYAPYNPQMLDTYLTIFRTVNNFVFVGDDGRTPAMRLGIAQEPLGYEDILWPGVRVPGPKRERRKGRTVAVPPQEFGARRGACP